MNCGLLKKSERNEASALQGKGRFTGNNTYAAQIFGDPLESIGLIPVDCEAENCGILFKGDGERSSGWYWSWSCDSEFAVVSCDFTLLKSLPFTVAFGRYLAVRKERYGIMPPSTVSVFLETSPRTSTVVLPAGSRFSYVEIEYFDSYCLATFGQEVDGALGPLAACLKELRGSAAWDSEIERLLESIDPNRRGDVGTFLAYSSIADGVMSRLLAMEGALAKRVTNEDRCAIMEVIDYVRANLGLHISQEDLTGIAHMGATKFKRAFKHVTGVTVTEFIAAERAAYAKQLLSEQERPIEEIAHLCGFERATSFSAFFSKMMGMSPRAWRKYAQISFDDNPESAVSDALGKVR